MGVSSKNSKVISSKKQPPQHQKAQKRIRMRPPPPSSDSGSLGGSGSGSGDSSKHPFKAASEPPTPKQAKKLFKNQARNVNLKSFFKGENDGDIGVTEFSPPSRGGSGKFYRRIIDKLGNTIFHDRWTKGDR